MSHFLSLASNFSTAEDAWFESSFDAFDTGFFDFDFDFLGFLVLCKVLEQFLFLEPSIEFK